MGRGNRRCCLHLTLRGSSYGVGIRYSFVRVVRGSKLTGSDDELRVGIQRNHAVYSLFDHVVVSMSQNPDIKAGVNKRKSLPVTLMRGIKKIVPCSGHEPTRREQIDPADFLLAFSITPADLQRHFGSHLPFKCRTWSRVVPWRWRRLSGGTHHRFGFFLSF